MSQFTIFDNHRKPYYPNQMEPEEKKELREKCIREGLSLYCRCNEQCEYGIRDKTWAIYPRSKTQVYKDWCPKSELYKRSMIYNKGFKINEKTGQINVYLSEPISEKRKKHKRQYTYSQQTRYGFAKISFNTTRKNYYIRYDKKDEHGSF